MSIQLKFGGQAMVIEDLGTIGSHTPTASVTTDLGTIPVVPDSTMQDGCFFCIRFDGVPDQIRKRFVDACKLELEFRANWVLAHAEYRQNGSMRDEDLAYGPQGRAKEIPADDSLYRLHAKCYGSNGSILEEGYRLTVHSGGRVFSAMGTDFDLGMIKSFALL